MNSAQLKKDFPEEYKQFFLGCQKVVSAPHTFFWTGDFSGFYGGLTISSKIPMRFYVGLEETGKGKFAIDKSLRAYHPAERKFIHTTIDEYLLEIIAKEVGPLLDGYTMHFFSELTLGLSLGGLGAMSAAISALLFEDASERIRFASKLVKSLQQGRTSPATAFASLNESAYPIVFYCDENKCWGKSIDQIANLPEHVTLPFDYGLVFSGNLVQGSAVIRSAEELMDVASKREQTINKLIGKSTSEFWPTYLAMLEQISLANLNSMIEVLQNGARENSICEFFDSMNQYQNLLHFLSITTPNIDKIYSLVHRLANNNDNNVGSGCKITGVGKGGEVLFAMPYGQYRNKIGAQLGAISDNITLDYASWLDQVEARGAVLEQDLASNNLASFVKKGMLQMKLLSIDGDSTRLVGADFDFSQIELAIDRVSNKILIKGVPVDSSQLPSQKATVEILYDLLNSKNFELKNSRLKKSYGKSRYDLQSKITIPLEKLTGLKFEISGGAYDDYILKLKPFDITIAIISTI